MQKSYRITCDRHNGIFRVAVWLGESLLDLSVAPCDNICGAVVGARVSRPAVGNGYFAASGHPLDSIFFNSNKKFNAGDYVILRIKSPPLQGKAWLGSPLIVSSTDDDPIQNDGSSLELHNIPHVLSDTETDSTHLLNIIAPPKPLWVQSVQDIWSRLQKNRANNKKKTAQPIAKQASIEFSDARDHAEFTAWSARIMARVPITLLPRAGDISSFSEIDDAIDALCSPRVDLTRSAWLMIETTESLTAIDVNSGMQNNFLATNTEALLEIARQIRIRNISGIIVIDPAGTTPSARERAQLIGVLENAVSEDRCEVRVAGFTRLGLIELTREREGYSLAMLASQINH